MMKQRTQIIPQTQAPQLSFSLTNGNTWSLSKQDPDFLTMVVFYRGLHCPVCKSYTKKLDSIIDEYHEKGVEVVTVSMDSEERAKQSVQDWDLKNIAVGYELKKQQAREWGLFLSKGIKDEEPDLFSEPGLFLVRPDGELYYSAVNSMPFGRPDLEALLQAFNFVKKQNYPARGEVK